MRDPIISRWRSACGFFLFLVAAGPGFSQTTLEQWKSKQKAILEDKALVLYYDFEGGNDYTLKNKSRLGKDLVLQRLDG